MREEFTGFAEAAMLLIGCYSGRVGCERHLLV